MKAINETILAALKSAVEKAGSQSEFARRAGIGRQHVSKYLKRDVKNLEHETWIKIYPFVSEFLPHSGDAPYDAFAEPQTQWNSTELAPSPAMKHIPVISMAQAISFDCTLEAFDAFALSQEHEFAPMLAEKNGMLAVKITGDSMTPWYPSGTVVYINSRDYPRSGKRVIAKLKDEGAIVFKIFYREGSTIKLLSIDSSGRDFSWERPEENPFAWIYPIKYSLRDEDAIDREMNDHGIPQSWREKL